MTAFRIHSINLPGLLAGTLAFLSGCAGVEPVRTSNEASKPTENRVAENAPQTSELTSESSLSDYLRIAALNNPGLAATFHRWKAALERAPQVQSLPDPRFNYSYFVREIETRVGPQEHRIGVTQTFPWFGKLRLRGDKAGEAALAAQQRYEAEKWKLFNEVKNAYYEMFYLRQSILIAEENIELLKHLEAVAQAAFRSGSDITGVVKAQVEFGKLEDRLSSLESLHGPIAARINAALNRDASATVPWPNAFDAHVPAFDSEQDLFDLLESENPELHALRSEIAQGEAAVALARKDIFPDVSLGVDYIATGEARMPGVADSGQDSILIMGSVNLPLWLGKYRAAIREAEFRRAAAMEASSDKENALQSELRLALYRFQDAERKASLFRDTLTPLAESSLGVAEQAYESGEADFLELIDAQRLLLEIQLSYERAVADREQGLAQIEMLVGKKVSRLDHTIEEQERRRE